MEGCCWPNMVSFLNLKNLLLSAVKSCTGTFSSFSSFTNSRERISESSGEWRPAIKIKHLNWSSVSI